MGGFFLSVDAYFTDIEDEFGRLRGKSFRASPKDWALIESWKEREIPLHIIFRSLDKCFADNREREIYSLGYCSKEVERQYAEWLPSQVGKGVEKA